MHSSPPSETLLKRPDPENHHWGARWGVGMAMLILASLGVLLSFFNAVNGWEYWKWIVLGYPLLALGLSLFVRRKKGVPHSIWHEVLHWLGLLAAVLLVVFYVHLGIVSKNMGALFILTLLAFAVFLAGVYIERTFFAVGVVLAIFAVLVAYTAKFLLAAVVFVLILAAAVIAYLAYRNRKKSRKTPPV